MGHSLIRGEHKVGSTLTGDTVRVADVNGLTNPRFEYQPQRVDDATQTDIPGAVSKTYTLTDEDVDKRVQLQVQFTDNNAHHETRSGPATSTITPGPATRKVSKRAAADQLAPPPFTGSTNPDAQSRNGRQYV